MERLDKKNRELQAENKRMIDTKGDKLDELTEQNLYQEEMRLLINNNKQTLDHKFDNLVRKKKELEMEIESIRESNSSR